MVFRRASTRLVMTAIKTTIISVLMTIERIAIILINDLDPQVSLPILLIVDHRFPILKDVTCVVRVIILDLIVLIGLGSYW